jgi:hypothetical protein
VATNEVVISVEVNARSEQIEVTTMQRGKGRHQRYAALNQAPPEMRGEALALLRRAVMKAGYTSLAALEEALTSDVVVPEPEPEAAESADARSATAKANKAESARPTKAEPA